jgi:putative redox protein
MITVELTNPDFGFLATDVNGNTAQFDIAPEQGGHGKGLRPMQTLLAALCSCSGVDVVIILKKQRQLIRSFKMNVEGEREPGKEPSLWRKVTLHYELYGELEPAKVYRAIDLSVRKYCSVAETLRRGGATIEWTLTVNGEGYSEKESKRV